MQEARLNFSLAPLHVLQFISSALKANDMVFSNESSYRNPRVVPHSSSSFEKNMPQSSVAARKNDQWNVRRDIPVGTVRNSPFSPEPKQQPPPSPQLRHQKMQWDTSNIPKGSVAARVQQTNSPSSKNIGNKPVSPSMYKGGAGYSRPKTFSYGSPGYSQSYSTEVARSNNGKFGGSSSQFRESTSAKPSEQTSTQQQIQQEPEKVVPKKSWEPSREIPTGTVQGRLLALFGGQNTSTGTKAKDSSTSVKANSTKVGYDKPSVAVILKHKGNSNDGDDQWIIPDRKGETVQVFDSDWGEAIPAKSAESDDWETPAKDWIRSGDSQTEASSLEEVEEKVPEKQHSPPTEIAAPMPDEIISKIRDGEDDLQRNESQSKPSPPSLLPPPPNDANAYHKPKDQKLEEDTLFDHKSSLSQDFGDNFENFSEKAEIDLIDKSKAGFSSSTDAFNQQLISGASDAFGFPLSLTPEVAENKVIGEIVSGDEFFDASALTDDYGNPPGMSPTLNASAQLENDIKPDYDPAFDDPTLLMAFDLRTTEDEGKVVSVESDVEEHIEKKEEVLTSSQSREYSSTTHNAQGNDEIVQKRYDQSTRKKSGYNLDGYHAMSTASSYDDSAQSASNELKSGKRDSKKKRKGFFKGLFGRKGKSNQKVKEAGKDGRNVKKSSSSTPKHANFVTNSHNKNPNETLLLQAGKQSGPDEHQMSTLTERNSVHELVDESSTSKEAIQKNESEVVEASAADASTARGDAFSELQEKIPSLQEVKSTTSEDVFLDPELDHLDSNHMVSDEESRGDLSKTQICDNDALDTGVGNSSLSQPSPKQESVHDSIPVQTAKQDSSRPVFSHPSALEAPVQSLDSPRSGKDFALDDKCPQKGENDSHVDERQGRKRVEEGTHGRRNRLTRNARKNMGSSTPGLLSTNQAETNKKFYRATYAYNTITKKHKSEDTEDERRYLSIPAASTSASDISYTSSTYDSYQKKLSESLKKANIVAKNSSEYSLHSRSLDDSSIESDIRVLRAVLRRPRLDYNNDRVIQASRQNQDFPTYDTESVTDPMQRLGMRLLSSAIIPIQTEVRRFLATRHAMTRMWALIMIQTYTRRFLARKKFRKAVSSAITIQSIVRGHLGRKEVTDKHICAIEIQRHVRGYLATMQVYEDIYKVTLVQSLVRMRIAMDYAAYRMSLIIQVQAIARGFLERRRHVHRNRCATMIQSSWRCFYNRMNYQFDLLDIIIVQSLWRKKMAVRVAERKIEEKRHMAATTIQAAWRAYDCRMDYLSYHAEVAATVIQSKWRSYDCQMNYLHFLSDVLTVQSTIRRFLAQRKVKAMIDHDAALIQSAWRRYVCRKNYEREKAAILIQSTWRGFLFYADYMFELSDIVVVQKQMRCWLAKRAADRRRQELKDIAAASIQKHWRRIFDERRYEILKREARASTIIQKYWRRFWCFSNFVIALDSSIQLQAQIRGFLDRNNYSSKKLAVSVIGDAWLDAQAKRLASQTSMIDEMAVTGTEVVAKESRAAIKLQQMLRGALCRNALKAYLAAVLIQSRVRGNQARVAVSLYISVRKIQAAWRGFVPRQDFLKYRKECDSAILIQSAWRGFVSYTDYVFTMSDIVTAQRVARGYLTRKKYSGPVRSKISKMKVKFNGAVALQKIFRGFQARQNYWYALGCTMQIQNWWRGQLVKMRIQREADAICTLQCFARCCLARQEYMQRRFVFMLIQTAELERSKKAKGIKQKEQRRDKSDELQKNEFSDVDHDQASQLMLATKRRKEWREKMKKEKDTDDDEESMLEDVWTGVVAKSDFVEEPFTRHYDDFSAFKGPAMPPSPLSTSSIRMLRKVNPIDINDDFQLEEAFIDAEICHAKERRSFAGNGRSKRMYPPSGSTRGNTKSTTGGKRVVASVAGKKKRTTSVGRERSKSRGHVLSMSNH